MNIKKTSLITIFLLFLLLTNITFVYAVGETVTKETNKQELTEKNPMFNETEDPRDPGLPVVTVDDMSAWTERKGFEVIRFLQKFIQPFAIIIFIFSGIVTLTGALGNGKQVSKGLVGMFIALIMYIIVLYAPEIMDIFLNWVQN